MYIAFRIVQMSDKISLELSVRNKQRQDKYLNSIIS